MNKIEPNNAGCWLDGHMGWHNHYRVIDVAFGWGWKPADEADVRVISHAYEYQRETVTLASGEVIDTAGAMLDQGGLVDSATEYLESIAPEGYTFEWDMGELSLIHETETEWWEE